MGMGLFTVGKGGDEVVDFRVFAGAVNVVFGDLRGIDA